MRCLLDTCIVIWALEDNKTKLGKFVKIIEDPENEIVISVVSYLEIVIKVSLGKLKIPDNWIDLIEETGFDWLYLEPKHIQKLENLPLIHNDPFDRLLISQAQAEQMKLLTADEKILQYGKI